MTNQFKGEPEVEAIRRAYLCRNGKDNLLDLKLDDHIMDSGLEYQIT